MPAGECTIVIERLADDWYRASCPLFADCEAFAATEADARQAVAEAIDRIMRQREAIRTCGNPHESH
jgi:predicted RNase H-like HicB family nuclease